MKNRIKAAFEGIHADSALLQKTASRIQEERLKRSAKRPSPRLFQLGVALLATLVVTLGLWGYRTDMTSAYAYIGIDVNPSVELVLNQADKVIRTTAYNTEGEALLGQVHLDGKPHDEALSLLLDAMALQGYLSEDALVTLTVQTQDAEKEAMLQNTLLQSVNHQIAPTHPLATVEVIPVTQEAREAAHGCHMSTARYLAIQALMAVDETATPEAYVNSSLRQIRQRTRECRDAHKAPNAPSEDTAHNGHRRGHGGR